MSKIKGQSDKQVFLIVEEAKDLKRRTGLTVGNMRCPQCKDGEVTYWAPGNRVEARCSTDGCISFTK